MVTHLTETEIDCNLYMPLVDSEKHMFFEHFAEDQYQLIVKKNSPFKASRISLRENGDYATKDLFIKSKSNALGYRYAGRLDDTLVM